MAGFSPRMYIPRIVPASAASMISVTVRPGTSDSVAPHARSKRWRTAGSATRL
jgi:hypothetical protein